MGLLDFIFGAKKRQVQTYLKKGALILDVRPKEEFVKGFIPNSIFIPYLFIHSSESIHHFLFSSFIHSFCGIYSNLCE